MTRRRTSRCAVRVRTVTSRARREQGNSERNSRGSVRARTGCLAYEPLPKEMQHVREEDRSGGARPGEERRTAGRRIPEARRVVGTGCDDGESIGTERHVIHRVSERPTVPQDGKLLARAGVPDARHTVETGRPG